MGRAKFKSLAVMYLVFKIAKKEAMLVAYKNRQFCKICTSGIPETIALSFISYATDETEKEKSIRCF